MTESNTSSWSITRVLLVFAVAGVASIWAYRTWVVEPEAKKQRHAVVSAKAAQRFQDWAYVAKSKEIAPGEVVKLVVIPSPYGMEILDTKCLIYTNQAFKTSSFICPDAGQSDLDTRNE